MDRGQNKYSLFQRFGQMTIFQAKKDQSEGADRSFVYGTTFVAIEDSDDLNNSKLSGLILNTVCVYICM